MQRVAVKLADQYGRDARCRSSSDVYRHTVANHPNFGRFWEAVEHLSEGLRMGFLISHLGRIEDRRQKFVKLQVADDDAQLGYVVGEQDVCPSLPGQVTKD